MTLLLSTRVAAATVASNAAGGMTVGRSGHPMTTAAGTWLPGSTNSMLSVWSLMVPLDSGVVEAFPSTGRGSEALVGVCITGWGR